LAYGSRGCCQEYSAGEWQSIPKQDTGNGCTKAQRGARIGIGRSDVRLGGTEAKAAVRGARVSTAKPASIVPCCAAVVKEVSHFSSLLLLRDVF
jgi:hypothetical protein